MGLTLPVKNFHDHHRVAAPALRRRTHVSAFALADDRHDPDGTPIAVCQVPGLYRVEVQRPIFRSPILLNYLYNLYIFIELDFV